MSQHLSHPDDCHIGRSYLGIVTSDSVPELLNLGVDLVVPVDIVNIPSALLEIPLIIEMNFAISKSPLTSSQDRAPGD